LHLHNGFERRPLHSIASLISGSEEFMTREGRYEFIGHHDAIPLFNGMHAVGLDSLGPADSRTAERLSAVDTFEATISTLIEGPRTPVLVVDFRLFGVDATLAGLLASGPRGHGIYRVDPVTDLAATGRMVGLDEVAERYAEQAERSGLMPGIVVAYCSAASLAMRIAARLGGVRTVLVDPTWVDDGEVRTAVSSVRTALGLPHGAALADVSSVPSIMSALSADLVRKLIADGLDDEERELVLPMLEQQLAAWFGFLVATRSATIPDPRQVQVIASSGSGRGAAPAWTDVQPIYLPGEPEALLGQDRLGRMIIEFASEASAI
jgi:hypothetical protein